MALTAAQEVLVAEIMLEPLSVVQAVTLTAAQELLLSDDLDVWEGIRDSHVKLEGEVNFDNARKRDAIRARVRKMYGLPLYSEEVIGSSGSYALPNIPVF